jgi:hypothetical protein
MRMAIFIGFIFSALSLIVALAYLVLKLVYWNRFPAGNAPVLIGVFLLGSIQLFFIGLLGEYIVNINLRVMKRLLVIEEKRINFDEPKGNLKG